MAAQQGLPMAVEPIGHGWSVATPQKPEERITLLAYIAPVYPATNARDLREARQLARLSQRQLADKMGVPSATTIHFWETGQCEPKTRNLVRLARALDVPLETAAGWFTA